MRHSDGELQLQRKATVWRVVIVTGKKPCVHPLRRLARCGASRLVNPVRSAVQERISRIVFAVTKKKKKNHNQPVLAGSWQTLTLARCHRRRLDNTLYFAPSDAMTSRVHLAQPCFSSQHRCCSRGVGAWRARCTELLNLVSRRGSRTLTGIYHQSPSRSHTRLLCFDHSAIENCHRCRQSTPCQQYRYPSVFDSRGIPT